MGSKRFFPITYYLCSYAVICYNIESVIFGTLRYKKEESCAPEQIPELQGLSYIEIYIEEE